MSNTHQAPLLVIGHFPPPVHGFSIITAEMANRIEDFRPVRRMNLSRPAAHFVVKHFGQALRAISVSAMLFSHRLRGSREASIGVNGGLGALYTLLIVATGRMLGFRMVLHHHSYAYINRRSSLMATLLACGGRRAEHVFLGYSMATAFKSVYGPVPLSHVVQNAMFVQVQPQAPRKPGSLRIGFLSNLCREKGLYDFLDLARTAHNAGDAATFHLAGPAGLDADRKAIETMVAEGILTWEGPLYGSEKENFFANIDIFVFPTLYVNEAQPTVIYEAFAAGAGVISYRRGCIEEQVGDCLYVLSSEDQLTATCREIFSATSTEDTVRIARSARLRLSDAASEASRNLAAIYYSDSKK